MRQMLKIALPLPQQQPQHPEGPEKLATKGRSEMGLKKCTYWTPPQKMATPLKLTKEKNDEHKTLESLECMGTQFSDNPTCTEDLKGSPALICPRIQTANK